MLESNREIDEVADIEIIKTEKESIDDMEIRKDSTRPKTSGNSKLMNILMVIVGLFVVWYVISYFMSGKKEN